MHRTEKSCELKQQSADSALKKPNREMKCIIKYNNEQTMHLQT